MDFCSEKCHCNRRTF